MKMCCQAKAACVLTRCDRWVRQAQDFRIQYDSIMRLFLLPKNNTPHTLVRSPARAVRCPDLCLLAEQVLSAERFRKCADSARFQRLASFQPMVVDTSVSLRGG